MTQRIEEILKGPNFRERIDKLGIRPPLTEQDLREIAQAVLDNDRGTSS